MSNPPLLLTVTGYGCDLHAREVYYMRTSQSVRAPKHVRAYVLSSLIAGVDDVPEVAVIVIVGKPLLSTHKLGHAWNQISYNSTGILNM